MNSNVGGCYPPPAAGGAAEDDELIMTGREWDALRIVRWMHRQEETDLAAWLSEDFVYDDGINVGGERRTSRRTGSAVPLWISRSSNSCVITTSPRSCSVGRTP